MMYQDRMEIEMKMQEAWYECNRKWVVEWVRQHVLRWFGHATGINRVNFTKGRRVKVGNP